MSTIRPLPGIRYATQSAAELSRLLAPPYDVLDERGKQELVSRHPHNFVVVDLPHMPPKSAGPAAVYQQARRTLDEWLRTGVMVQDAQPAIYVYHQAYTHGGTSYVRKMFFARLRLEPFGAGSIFPHEKTFGGPKEDRLALTKATEANLSPIFGLYQDKENAVARRLEQAIGPKPLQSGTLDGVESRLWAVTDAAAIDAVAQLMESKPTYIADGHHRCGTAMLYRDWLVEQRGALPEEHAANFVLCVFCAMEDPGLLILPTHRVLDGLNVGVDSFADDPKVEITPLDVEGPTAAIAALATRGPQAVALYNGKADKYFALRPTRPDILDPLEKEHTEPWRRLGLAFLHAYILDRVITPKMAAGKSPEIHYIKSDEDAVGEAKSTNGVAFLMQPTTMEELRAVCLAGDLMPQKSTYFFPKLASGLVVNPLTR